MEFQNYYIYYFYGLRVEIGFDIPSRV